MGSAFQKCVRDINGHPEREEDKKAAIIGEEMRPVIHSFDRRALRWEENDDTQNACTQ